MLRKILITQEPEEQGKTKKKLQPRTASAVSPVESGPEERPDEAEAASQEAAERAPPAPAAAAGVLPRGRRHLQVRVRRVLHQRVPDHVYVPAAAAAAADDAMFVVDVLLCFLIISSISSSFPPPPRSS